MVIINKNNNLYGILKIDANIIYKTEDEATGTFSVEMDLDKSSNKKKIVREADNPYFRIIRNTLSEKYSNTKHNNMSEIIMVDCSYTKVNYDENYFTWLKDKHKKEIKSLQLILANTRNKLKKDKDISNKTSINKDQKTIKSVKEQLKKLRENYNKKITNLHKADEKCKNIETRLLPNLIDNGFEFNGHQFKLLGMSGSMARNGIKAFVREDIWSKVFTCSTLEKKPTKAQIPKYEAYRNLLFSSAKMMECIPNIVIVKDYNITINDVAIRYPVDEIKEIICKDLDGNVMKDAEGNPVIKQLNCKVMKDGITGLGVNCFDGAGIHSVEFNEKLMHFLKDQCGIDYVPISYQIRLPYMKGLSTCVDFKLYFNEHNITRIKDIDGVWHDVKDIDCIWTESMWKGVKFFISFKEYIDLVKKYNHVFAITQWNKPSSMESDYTRINFQYLQALKNLKSKDLIELANYSKNWIKNIVSDPKAVIEFLNIANNENSEDSEETIKATITNDNNFMEAIKLNPEIIYDVSVKNYLIKLLKKYVKQMKYGKLFTKGKYYYATPDFYLYLTYIANSSGYDVPITSCLTGNQMYSKGLLGIYGSFRSPLLAENEINKVELVENEITQKYFNHFDNIVMINSASKMAMKQQTMDFDGDRIFLTPDKIICNAIKPDLPLIMDLNEAKPPLLDYNQENIKIYHMRTLDCLIGEQSNKATVLHNKTNASKYLEQIELLSIIIQKETDYVKAGIRWECGAYIDKLTRTLPYFLIYRYDTLRTEYLKVTKKRNNVKKTMKKNGKTQYEIDTKLNNEPDLALPVNSAKSPMNTLCKDIEKFENEIRYKMPTKDVRHLFINETNTIDKDLLDDKEKDTYEKLEKLFSTYNEDIVSNIKLQNKKDKSKEERKALKLFNWDSFNQAYKEDALKICSDQQLLLRYLADICYSDKNKNKRKSFIWSVCGDTILENLKNTNSVAQ